MVAGKLQHQLRIITAFIAVLGTSARILLSFKSGYGIQILFFFTIQSNLMVCIILIVNLMKKKEDSTTSTILHGGILLYILMTGIIYNLFLASGVEARGLNLLISTINHTITPLLFLSDWLLFRRRKNLEWRHLNLWLIYPAAYLAAASIEGAIRKVFRYPFLDFIKRDTFEYAAGIGIIIAAFIIVGSAIILMEKIFKNTLNNAVTHTELKG